MFGLTAAIKAPHLAYRGSEGRDIGAAARPGEGMQAKSLRFDRGAVPVDPGRHMDLKPGLPRGPRHRQAMRAKIPILGDKIEQAGRGHQ